MARTYQPGDWVKCPVDGRRWVYGHVMHVLELIEMDSSIRQRVLVDQGYLGAKWFGVHELTPAVEPQNPEEITAIRDALTKMVEREKPAFIGGDMCPECTEGQIEVKVDEFICDNCGSVWNTQGMRVPCNTAER